jgi:hypothetical protein
MGSDGAGGLSAIRESLSKHVDLFARIKQLGGGF